MPKGKVKWFNSTKGYGFIEAEDGNDDVFVHISAVKSAGMQDLDEGQEVEYDLVENNGKTSAENLKQIKVKIVLRPVACLPVFFYPKSIRKDNKMETITSTGRTTFSPFLIANLDPVKAPAICATAITRPRYQIT